MVAKSISQIETVVETITFVGICRKNKSFRGVSWVARFRARLTPPAWPWAGEPPPECLGRFVRTWVLEWFEGETKAKPKGNQGETKGKPRGNQREPKGEQGENQAKPRETKGQWGNQGANKGKSRETKPMLRVRNPCYSTVCSIHSGTRCGLMGH